MPTSVALACAADVLMYARPCLAMCADVARGNLSIDEATNFTNLTILTFLAQMLDWPYANNYEMPERSYVAWRI